MIPARVEPDNRPTTGSPGLVWEETACPLCGRDDAGLLTEAADPLPGAGRGLRFALVRCRHCGLVYTNPRPSPESIRRFYPSDYAPHRASPEVRRQRSRSWSARWLRPWHRLTGRYCPERRGHFAGMRPGRLLDFGCGGGGYLKRMAELGWAVTGLDFAPEAVRSVRETVGCPAYVGTLPHPAVRPGSFDVVTLWQVLEHVHRPLATLREVYRILVPGGRVVVAVPNFESLAARWYGPHWYGLDVPRHLTHFTPATLLATLRAAGFVVLSLRGLAHSEWLRKSAVLARRAGRLGLRSRLFAGKPLARLASWAGYLLGRPDSLVAVARRPG